MTVRWGDGVFICERHGCELVGCAECREERHREYSAKAKAAQAKRSATLASEEAALRAQRLRAFPIFVAVFNTMVKIYDHVSRLPFVPPTDVSTKAAVRPRRQYSTFATRRAARFQRQRILLDVLCALAPRVTAAIDREAMAITQEAPPRLRPVPREPFYGSWRDVPMRALNPIVLRDMPSDVARHSAVGVVADLDALPFALRDRSRSEPE